MLPCNIISGQCMGCRNILNSSKYRKSLDEVNNSMPDGYTVIGEYVNNKTPTLIRHKCGCEFVATVTNVKLKNKAQKCPKCFSNKSKAETELYKFVSEKIDSKQNYKHRDSINKHKFKELDILTDSNIGFEFDGLYWHSTDRRSASNLLDKTEYFLKLNIPVIHIFEDEWNDSQNSIENIISDIIKNRTQYILINGTMVPFSNNFSDDEIIVDRRFFISDKDIINAGYYLSDTLPPKEYFLDGNCNRRFSERTSDTKFSIFDCGYYIYKKK